MFVDQGPVHAARKQREFLEDFAPEVPAAQKAVLREMNAEVSPVPLLLGGMEVLYVLAKEVPLSSSEARLGVLDTLGYVSTAVGVGQYGGPESRDRAWALAAWAAHEIEPIGPAPEAPAVSPTYTTIAPEPEAVPGPEE